MKNLTVILTVLCMGLFASCKTQSSEESITTIHLEETNNECRWVAKYIQLESVPEALIGSIDQIEATDKYLFILYGDSAYQGVYVFDHNGKYVAKIGNFGRGTGEYALPTSFTIGDGIITILDCGKNYALNYDINTFRYIDSHPIFNTSYFEWADGNTMICSNEEHESTKPFYDKQYVAADKSFNPTAGFIDKIIVSGYATGPSRPMYKYNGKIRTYTQFEPFVYEFNQTEFRPIYEINFGKFQLPSIDFIQQISQTGKNYYTELTNSGKISFYSIFETPQTVLVNFIANHNKYLGLYSKKESVGTLYNKTRFQEEILPITTIAGTMGDYYISPLFTSELRQEVNSGKVYPQEIQDILKTAKDDDNPILLLFKPQ